MSFFSISVYEEHLIDRTKSVSKDGVDFVIDYFSSPRSTHRAMLVLHRVSMMTSQQIWWRHDMEACSAQLIHLCGESIDDQ